MRAAIRQPLIKAPVIGLVISLVIACQSQDSENEGAKPELPRAQRVKIEGEEASATALSQRQFNDRVQKYLAAKQGLLAREFVLEHYDYAHNVLVTVNPKSKPELWNFICEVVDNKAWFGVRSLTKRELESHYRLLADFRFNLEQDSGEAVFQRKLDGLNAPKVLLAEMRRLRGIAYFLREQFQEAETHFKQASQLSRDDLYLNSRCLLYLGESQRRQEKLKEGAKNWELSLEKSLAPRQFGRAVPKHWESIIYWKQAKIQWPKAAEEQLMRHLYFVRLGAVTQSSAQDQTQALVWALIAQQQQKRKNWQEALSAAKKAEVLFQDQGARWRMQLAGAQALLGMKKTQTGTAILVDLGQNSQGAAQSGALAILGSLALNNDKFRRGHGLLTRAVQGDDWPEKGEAMADLGLACFLIGETAEGVRWLKSARQRFTLDQRFGDYLQSLNNEKAYFEHVGDREQIERLDAELEKFQEVRKS